MASIQDVVNTAYRISDSAKYAQQRTQVCADSLNSSAQRLGAVVRGSRTGEAAVAEVNSASRAVRESALRLLKLRDELNSFIKDIQQ